MASHRHLLQPPQFLLMAGELVPVAIAGQPHLDRAAREKGEPDIEIARQAEGAVQTLQLAIEPVRGSRLERFAKSAQDGARLANGDANIVQGLVVLKPQDPFQV